MATEEQCRERGGKKKSTLMGEKSWRQSVVTLSLLTDTTYGINFKILGDFLQVIMFTRLSENLTSHLELEVNVTESQIHL